MNENVSQTGDHHIYMFTRIFSHRKQTDISLRQMHTFGKILKYEQKFENVVTF